MTCRPVQMDSTNAQAALIGVTLLFGGRVAKSANACITMRRFLRSLAALVGLFGIIACDVVQAMFDDLFLEVGFLLRPGPERGAEAVRRQGFVPSNLLQMLEHRHVGDWLRQAATREHKLLGHAALIGLAQKGQRLPGQWRALEPFVLGIKGAQIPNSAFEVELRPAHVLHLDGSRECEDGDLKRPGTLIGIGVEPLHERGQIMVVHGLVAATYGATLPLFRHDRLQSAVPIGRVVLKGPSG